jgi:hypothetical protein
MHDGSMSAAQVRHDIYPIVKTSASARLLSVDFDAWVLVKS